MRDGYDRVGVRGIRAKIDRFQSFGVASLTAEFDVSLVMRADFDSSHARRCVCALRFDYLAGAAILLVSAKIDGFPTLAMDNEIRCSLSIAILCLSVAIQTRCNDWLTTTDAALLHRI
ncbi:hypothetical protein OUZ56_027637 [Daphnia magna]|uniref:Uncharacterized protein n=1 Tax=Daphnia magna TaxID=35525 RepID=A0ABR0B1M6_9CRUS|nr:hypothetical protein OUZ56_027637 [Daphnia magna]